MPTLAFAHRAQNCKGEFDYAVRRQGVDKIVPVVMERGCLNPDDWSGSVGFRLGSKLYFDLSEGSTRPPDDAIDRLAAAIKELLPQRRNTSERSSSTRARLSKRLSMSKKQGAPSAAVETGHSTTITIDRA